MSHNETSDTIILDATNWKNREDFYKDYCSTTEAPDWFGNNLDAFNDSLRGGICGITPQKIIIENLTNKIREDVGTKFIEDLQEICQEAEVEFELRGVAN